VKKGVVGQIAGPETVGVHRFLFGAESAVSAVFDPFGKVLRPGRAGWLRSLRWAWLLLAVGRAIRARGMLLRALVGLRSRI
jgi:hypothetical protein